jgi:UPF0755 protein
MKPDPMKRVRAALYVLAGFALAMAFWMFRVGPQVDVIIDPGTRASQVGQILHEKGVVKSPLLFKILARLTRLDRRLKPGTYHLRANMSSVEAIWRLYRGGADYVAVSIPEGWRATQIAQRLEDQGVCSADEFTEVVMNRHWEGFLFPTTYFIGPNTPAAKVAEIMHEEFIRQAGAKLVNIPPPLLTPERVVTLASIVEREAVKPEERPMIARVYLNRLEKHWPLEADPTVQYAMGYWKKILMYKDLEFSSPYNTYRNPGLPPGPICSPSLSSILAVLAPAKTDALYFVADLTGGHTFAANYRQHLKNKEKFKAGVKEFRRELRKKEAAERRKRRQEAEEAEDSAEPEEPTARP